MALEHTFKLFEFNVYNSKGPSQSSDEDEEENQYIFDINNDYFDEEDRY